MCELSERHLHLWDDDLIFKVDEEKDRCGFVDKDGEWIIPAKFTNGRDFHDGLAAMSEDTDSPYPKWGYINTLGEFVIGPKFDGAGDFHEGLAWIEKDGWHNPRYGFINDNGEEVIDAIFDRIVEDFSNGYAKVIYKDDLKYIDKKGNMFDNLPKRSGGGD